MYYLGISSFLIAGLSAGIILVQLVEGGLMGEPFLVLGCFNVVMFITFGHRIFTDFINQ